MRDIAILLLSCCVGLSMLIVSASFAFRTFTAKQPAKRGDSQENEAENLYRRLHELQNSQFSMPPAKSKVPARLIESVLKKKEEENGGKA